MALSLNIQIIREVKMSEEEKRKDYTSTHKSI